MTNIPDLKPYEGSWAVVDKATRLAITELRRDQRPLAEKLNFDKYELQPIGVYLASLTIA